MSLQGMLGGLIEQVTGNSHPAPEAGKEAVEGGTSRGLLGAAVSALGGAQLTERLNQATSFLAPEQKSELVGGLLGKLGVSGTGAQALLQQLGINPAVADNPHEATPEELNAGEKVGGFEAGELGLGLGELARLLPG